MTRLATLALCVGGGTLIATSATADFIGLNIESKPNEFGILVCNVYAEFDRPGEDALWVIGGTAPAASRPLSLPLRLATVSF